MNYLDQERGPGELPLRAMLEDTLPANPPSIIEKSVNGQQTVSVQGVDDVTDELDGLLRGDGPNLPASHQRLRTEQRPERFSSIDEDEPLHKRAPDVELRKVVQPNGWTMEYRGDELVRGYGPGIDPNVFASVKAA